MTEFHLLHTDIDVPRRMNHPLGYVPHELCLVAAERVKRHLRLCMAWRADIEAGKMMGVLVCSDGGGRTGFLAAYSGQLCGRQDWPWFVPAAFDYMQPDGHFKCEERAITELNRRVSELESSDDFVSASASLQRLRAEAATDVERYRETMAASKARRDEMRALGVAAEADLVAESQFQKAELRRLKARWAEKTAAAERRLAPLADRLSALKRERALRSDALQRWLFDHFTLLDATGRERSLSSIFAATTQRVPPSGAGECCAPKLLQHAYRLGLRPLCMAEFWQGRSPAAEVRHHDTFYPACRGKCKPILDHMLGGLDVAPPIVGACAEASLTTVYEDSSIVVVDKPAGLPSVPGTSGLVSVQQLLRRRHPEVYMAHRLDMDTSGLMVVALTLPAYHSLQRQFEHHTVEKRYVALVEGHVEGRGTIELPLRPDPLDRPRQVVDHVMGRPCTTHYAATGHRDGLTMLELTPATGRTHQLRMHCAHSEGLGAPIVGDRLYGHAAPGQRLCLHAAHLSFSHPADHRPMGFDSRAPFL